METRRNGRQGGGRAIALALTACALVTALAWPFAPALDHTNVAMAYLLAVAVVAMSLGTVPAAIASFASVALFDFFFVEPRHSFAVADAQYLITFAVMLAVALMIGTLTARLRAAAVAAQERERRTGALYGLAHDLAGALDVATVESLVAAFARRELDVDAALLLPDASGTPCPVGARTLATEETAVAARALARGEALPFVERGRGACALALPLGRPGRCRGVLVVRSSGDVVVPAAQRPLLDALGALATTAIERIHFADVARDTEVAVAAERLRASVLSAVSHDLRTPLTVVVGLADTLAGAGAGLPAHLAATVRALRDEAMRLSRMVENLLDMARLRAGRVTLRKAWQPLEDVLGSSVRAAEPALAGREVVLDVAPDLPLVELDAVLVERALVNLLENAAKHAPGSPVELRARALADAVEVAVQDRGPGLPPGDPARLFAMFERGGATDAPAGAGMGLAIAHAIVEAHGGTLRAEPREGGGASFVVTLPAPAPPPAIAQLARESEAR